MGRYVPDKFENDKLTLTINFTRRIQEWKKVAACVKTRTVVQTRTHAQKYFQKVSKGIDDDEYMDELEPSMSRKKPARKSSSGDSSQPKKKLGDNSDFVTDGLISSQFTSPSFLLPYAA